MVQIAGLALHDHGGALATNASLWFAATGQAPDPKALADTATILEGLLRKAEPKAIVALGSAAAATLIGRTDAVSKLRGRWHRCLLGDTSIPVRVTYHPAYLCREPSARRTADTDMRELHKLLGEDTALNEEASAWLLDPLSPSRR